MPDRNESERVVNRSERGRVSTPKTQAGNYCNFRARLPPGSNYTDRSTRAVRYANDGTVGRSRRLQMYEHVSTRLLFRAVAGTKSRRDRRGWDARLFSILRHDCAPTE